MEVVLEFGIRNLGKAKGGMLVGALLILDKKTVNQLIEEGLLKSKFIDDRPGKTEWMFAASSAETVNRQGVWVYLPNKIFRK